MTKTKTTATMVTPAIHAADSNPVSADNKTAVYIFRAAASAAAACSMDVICKTRFASEMLRASSFADVVFNCGGALSRMPLSLPLMSPSMSLSQKLIALHDPAISMVLTEMILQNIVAFSLTNCAAFSFPQAVIERASFIDTHSPSESEFA